MLNPMFFSLNICSNCFFINTLLKSESIFGGHTLPPTIMVQWKMGVSPPDEFPFNWGNFSMR